MSSQEFPPMKSGTTELGISSQPSSTNPQKVLVELFELLEEYGPVWYTKEHHDRAVAALQITEGPKPPITERSAASQL